MRQVGISWSTLANRKRRRQVKPEPTAYQLGQLDHGKGGTVAKAWEAFKIACHRYGITAFGRHPSSGDHSIFQDRESRSVRFRFDAVEPRWDITVSSYPRYR